MLPLKYMQFKFDGLVKSQKMHFFVILAKAEVLYSQIVTTSMGSGFHRSDDFLRDHQI